jgi:bifunctional non-homologous end joining protein LigD
LIDVGHVGTGFNERELDRLMKLLKPLETSACPFATPSSDERAPTLGRAEARRADQVHRMDRGRQASPSGVSRLRDDKRPTAVVRETATRFHERQWRE